jgi:DNA-binding SARP family transcriptional activator
LPEQLEVVAHAVTAILATWLGLTVLTRAMPRAGAHVFTLLTGCLVIWSTSILVQRLTGDPTTVAPPFRAIEDLTAFLLPVMTLHIALVLAVEGRRSPIQQAVLVTAYATSAALGVAAVLFPDERLAVTPPHFELPGVPGEVFGWAWILARTVVLAAALYWIVSALTRAGPDRARRRQLLAALATISVGSIGGVIRILPGPADSDPWIGVSLIGLAVALAAYAVFSQGVFLSPDVGSRAFRYSIVIGLGVTLYVIGLVALDRATRSALAIDVPVATAMALVITLALFDPIAAWARRTVRGRTARESAYDRLLQALGEDVLLAQRPEGVVMPALARLSRTFGLLGAQVEMSAGVTLAHHGRPVGDSPIALRVPVRVANADVGYVTFGPKRSLLPFTPQEIELLTSAAGFLAASLQLAEREDVQAQALESLSAERVALHTHGADLSDAIVQAQARRTGLQVFALGPLRVERDGVLVRSWGGAKAGTRQAEAVFAFMYDRGDRGVTKDELIELIWPDVDLKHADLAFHRTMGGLRTTLEPGRRGGDRGIAISFHNDRYRLDSALVEWSDVRAFEDEMSAASATADEDAALRHLERARALYRGDYLDDCPFYGDSAQAEERREMLRGRCVDLLLALGDRYERRGDRPAAAASFRQARSMSGGALPPADAALARLGASA